MELELYHRYNSSLHCHPHSLQDADREGSALLPSLLPLCVYEPREEALDNYYEPVHLNW